MFSANTAISRKVLMFGKVRATIPKGIMGGFEFTVLQRELRIIFMLNLQQIQVVKNT